MITSFWKKPPRPFERKDRVWCPVYGVGIVTDVQRYGLLVRFVAGKTESFERSGKHSPDDRGRTLFLRDEVTL